MKTSQAGLDFIAKNEGLTLTIKPDVGHQMIGYGHDLLPGESYPNGITALQAWIILEDDVAKWDKAIASYNLTLTQNQHDVLADFTHNLGTGALGMLLAHNLDQVPHQLYHEDADGTQHGWVFAKDAHGVEHVLPGLVTRRLAEISLWNQV
jgi:GH24 family phage-related lysozyme (muramidase)